MTPPLPYPKEVRGRRMGTGKSKHSDNYRGTQALKELAESINKAWNSAAELSTQVPGLALYRNTAPTAPNPCTYEPSLLLIPQGKKRVDLGKQSYVFGESTFLLTSLELPIVSRVSVASASPVGTRGMVLGEATVELIAPCLRMVQLFGGSPRCPVLQ
jgi:hypothetical protein